MNTWINIILRMSDESDDGDLPGESFITKINKNNHFINQEEEYKNNYCDIYYEEDNSSKVSIPRKINTSSEYNSYYENNNYKEKDYDKEEYYNRNYYYNNYSNKKYYNNFRNNPVKFKVRKNLNCYLITFGIKFKSWLLNLICEEKKNIIFDNNDKINKEIIDSMNKYYIQKEKEKVENKIEIDIKDVQVKKIVSTDFNIEFKIIIREEIEILFIQKLIEIKVKGEMFYNDSSVFYFHVNKYKLSLINKEINKKEIKKEGIILNIENSDCEKYSDDALKLELKSQSCNIKEIKDFEDNDNNNQFAEHREELKLCLNELMESICYY